MDNNPASAVEGTPAKKIERDTFVISGAILLGSLIVAGAVLTLSPQVFSPAKNADTAAGNDKEQPSQQPDKQTVTLDQIKKLFSDKNIVLGNKNSKVLFVEFSDPSCPYCHIAAGKNPSLNKKVGPQFVMAQDGGSYVPPVPEIKKMVDAGKAAFVWLYTNGHGSGEMGTRALYCANEKGRFWEAHDLLMSEAGYDLLNGDVKNDKGKAGVLANFLRSAVNSEDMKSCLESGKYDSRIADDSAVAQQFGVNGTPNFFVNTANFTGAYSFKDMQSAVDQNAK